MGYNRFRLVKDNNFIQAYIGLTYDELNEISIGLESLMKNKDTFTSKLELKSTGQEIIITFNLVEKEPTRKRMIMSKIDSAIKILGIVGFLYTIYLIAKYLIVFLFDLKVV